MPYRARNHSRSRQHTSKPRQRAQFDPSHLVNNGQINSTAIDQTHQIQHQFADFNLHPMLLESILRKGYQDPTPIQDQAIPAILAGKDVVGLAKTGTGKTAAFLIPLIQKVITDAQHKILIIAPTRELAIQIQEECRSFSDRLRINSALCIGGVPIYRQIEPLRRRPNFVIGTPGRLKDLEKQGVINFSQYNTIVLDEVDQMLDMGFIHDIKHIVSRLAEKRHSLFFSATLADNVRAVMDGFLRNPQTISIQTNQTADTISQHVINTQGRPKIDILQELLTSQDFTKVLVFGSTKWKLNRLERDLLNRGFKVAAIHGNKSQPQRQRALKAFKENNLQALLATDIASRGLDIDNVSHVINFDLPSTYEDYIHRIGRTGRANNTGIALTFVEPN